MRLLLAAGFAYPLIADPFSPYAHRAGPVVAGIVTTVVVILAVAHVFVVRPVSGRWAGRTAAGVLLLVPAALGATRPFSNGGWDVDDCGSLVAPYRPADASMAGFSAACDTAASHRLAVVVGLAAAAVVVAVLYGVRVRARSGASEDSPASV